MANKKQALLSQLGATIGETEKVTERKETVLESLEDRIDKELAIKAERYREAGRPKKGGRPRVPRREYERRVTTIVNVEKWEKIARIAVAETLQVKEVVDSAITAYINKYEERNGVISVTKHTRGDVEQ